MRRSIASIIHANVILILGTDGGSILSYRLRQTGYAGLPGWISVAAARTANNIILHGTPTEGDEGVLHLMVKLRKERESSSYIGN